MTDKTNESSQTDMKSLIKKIIIMFSLVPVILGLLILIPAGTFNFWQVYLYFTILLVPMIFVIFYFLRNDPAFLERRIKAKEKEKEQIIIQNVCTITDCFRFMLGLNSHGYYPTGISIKNNERRKSIM